jgi:hypothetical protein
MSEHVAIYQVMSTSDTPLKAPGALNEQFKEISFTIPSDTATDNPPVLSFLVSISKAVNLKFFIRLNGAEPFLFLNDNGSRFVQQVVEHGNLIPGVVNTLRCAIESGSGNVAFSEMVLWFQRNI